MTWKRVVMLVLPACLLAAGFLPADAGDGDALRAELRERRASVAADDAAGLYRLGAWCREKGLADEARGLFEEVVRLDADHILARRALGYEKVDEVWLRGDTLRKARGLVKLDGRWVLREEAIAAEAAAHERLMKDERTRAERERAALLVRTLGSPDEEARAEASETLRAMPGDLTFRPLVAALNSAGPEAMRLGAVDVLATREPEQSLRPLVRVSITDGSESVREAAVAAVAAYDLPGALAPYATALGSADPQVRHHAIQAIGGLGQAQGLQILIRHWEQRGGGSPRANIFLGQQLSYIRDFDVEVAQTAFIADPSVGVLQEGSVLEVQVGATDRFFTTVERRLVQRSLRRLAGVDAGSDVKAWVSWAARNGHRLAAAPEDIEPTGDLR
jgi:hypothetical protein